MARESFKPTPADKGKTQEVATEEFGDGMVIDLDPKDPKAFKIIEVNDVPEEDQGRPTNVDDLAPMAGDSPSVQKRINRLKAETHTERRAREEAERREAAAIEAAKVANAQVEDLRRRLDGGNSALAASMKSDREGRLAQAEARLAAAHAEGDSATIAKTTNEMSLLNAELVQLATRTPPPRTAEQQQVPAQQQPAQQQPQLQQRAPNIAPNVLSWIAKNDGWFNKDTNKTKLALSLHDTITSRGVQPASPEYTRELDKGMKAMYPEHVAYDVGDNDVPEGQSTPRRTNVVADGSRETVRVSDPRRVELTSSELAVAKQLGLTSPAQLAAYALEKQKRVGKGA